jgi:hypothetical protein
MSNVKITPTDNGPYQVEGPVTVIDAVGTEYDIPSRPRSSSPAAPTPHRNRSATEPTKGCTSRQPIELPTEPTRRPATDADETHAVHASHDDKGRRDA